MDKTTKEIIGGMLPNQREVLNEIAMYLVNVIEGYYNKEEIADSLQDGIDTMNFIEELEAVK